MHSSTSLLRELIAIPSVNPFGKDFADDIYGESKLCDFLTDKLSKLGFATQIYEGIEKRPSFIAYLDLGQKETVALDAHLDTVSHLEMTIDPFDPVVKNGQLYGRGSCDTKSNMAIYISAVENLLKNNEQNVSL